jgi:hypothetical protein
VRALCLKVLSTAAAHPGCSLAPTQVTQLPVAVQMTVSGALPVAPLVGACMGYMLSMHRYALVLMQHSYITLNHCSLLCISQRPRMVVCCLERGWMVMMALFDPCTIKHPFRTLPRHTPHVPIRTHDIQSFTPNNSSAEAAMAPQQHDHQQLAPLLQTQTPPSQPITHMLLLLRVSWVAS